MALIAHLIITLPLQKSFWWRQCIAIGIYIYIYISSPSSPPTAIHPSLISLVTVSVAVQHRVDILTSPSPSYLRLSKDNVERLEQMIRAEGRDPGIHSHTDTENIDLAQLSEMASTSQMRPVTDTADLTKNFQPVSIYQTKAGAPIDKKRNARPDCVPPASEEEENLARMKKFKV